MNAKNWNKLVSAVAKAEAALQTAPAWSSETAATIEAAQAALDNAREALRKAFEETKLGANGSVFVTDRKIDWDGNRMRSLYINRRLRATYTYLWRSRRGGSATKSRIYVEVVSYAKAEEMYQAEKATRRVHEQTYREKFAELVEELRFHDHTTLKSFGDSWTYMYGQKGGTFCHRDGFSLSAHGALRAAWGDDWHKASFNPAWEHIGEVMEQKLYNTRY